MDIEMIVHTTRPGGLEEKAKKKGKPAGFLIPLFLWRGARRV